MSCTYKKQQGEVMIRQIRGKYVRYEKNAMIIESGGGIGFRVFVSDTSDCLNAKEGDEILVYTYMQVKEDGMSLYGFSDEEDLFFFEQLINVNGVGPKAALAILSTGTANQIKGHIVNKDAAALTKAQGIGKKTAERIILELCDKVSAVPVDEKAEISVGDIAGNSISSSEKTNAVLALTTLGYSRNEAEDAVSHITETDLSTEEYVKKALRYLF